ncbi:oxamate carbamoyltransferase subunit AllH family protein [Caldisericum exile]|uniref:DUF2877 domain-containing protein n=1 Tax=Caldisericum exile (strain DSM 21853 / NBRC 104410 / AZM16c01) TaxID=511051 RepID=A0A7U6JG01_CALEA|nr:DUF2877 domain-containing protein [Caldisericum exile]BAL80840.1 hypothetical protein CSE_07140 [Caldisericum exile AZM16c01]
MKVISVGDKIDLEFKILGIHSSFAHAINLYTDSGLVFLVSEDIGAGPNSVVVQSDTIEEIFINELKEALLHHSPVIYDSTFSLPHKDIDFILKNIVKVKNILKQYSQPLSSAFLIDPSRKIYFKGSFNLNLVDKLENYFNRLINFDFSSIHILKGLGYGFTPQGDDLIEGFLSAMYLYERLFEIDLSEIRNTIFILAQTQNEVSNTFLYFTSLGFFYERFKNVLLSLFTGQNLEQSVLKMLSFGETSGADILTGFVKGFEKLLEGGKKLWQ